MSNTITVLRDTDIMNCKKIYLCTPDNQILTALNGVRTETVDFHAQVKGYSELSFTVDRYVLARDKQIESNGYEDLKVYMNLYLEDIGFFQIQEPTIQTDGAQETKDVVAYSVEKEFENKDWKGIKINSGAIDSIEYLYEDNIDSFGFAKRYVVMYDENDKRFSFLDLILEKMPNWSIGYVDPRLSSAQIPNLEIENENLYAVMTSEVGPRLSCIFVFDYLHYTVNVYHKDNLDFDTGIFIGFRNLAQHVDVSVDQDSIFTRFSVTGADDLNLRYYNYGSDQIFNLNYFLGEPYMEDELADKYDDYLQFLDKYKEDYLEIVKQMLVYQNTINDLKYTVPSDDLAWKNWNGMNEEGLQENLAYYNSLLQSFQIVVDERPNEEKFSNYGTPEQTYNPILNNQGEVDHEWYLNKLNEWMGVYSGYYTYKDIHEYIIPYIELALENVERVRQGLEPIEPEDRQIGDPTENWDLYGYEELDGVRKNYEEDLLTKLTRYAKDWDEMTDSERVENGLNYVSKEDYDNSFQRKQYVYYTECLGNSANPAPGTIYYRLRELQQQIDENQHNLDIATITIGEYNNIMKYDITDTTSYGDNIPYLYLPQNVLEERAGLLFTEDEIALLNILFHDTDYSNQNIFITSLDTTYTTLDKEKELYDDAMEKLVEVSQPQYTFSVSLDNLFRLTDYEQWHEDFRLLRYIWLGIRDDYSVKLRIIGYRWNPCEVTPDLQLEFSNMITGKSGRSDLVQLLELENNSGSKNSISVGTGKTKSEQEYVSSLVQMLTNNTIFTKAVTGIIGNTTSSPDTAMVQNIVSDYMKTIFLQADSINVDNLIGTSAQFEELFTKYLTSDVIYAKFAEMEEVKIKSLSTDIITFGEDKVTEITGDYLRTAQIDADNINVTNAFVDNVLQVGSESGGFTSIINDNITTGTIVTKLLQATDVQADSVAAKIVTSDSVISGLVSAQEGSFDELTANTAFMQCLTANLITASEIQVDDLKAKLATVNVLNAQDFSADSAFIKSLQTLSSTSATSVIDDAYIFNAVADKIQVSDLKAGDITVSDQMRIVSDNGALVMNSSALQIHGTDANGNDYIGVQLGYATNGVPSLILRNNDGTTILTPGGITQDAIADELLVNDMIKKGTISEDRLNFNVMKQGDTVTIEQIYLGDKQFGAEWTNFTNGTNSALDELSQKVDEAQSYSLYIEAPLGTNIWGGNIMLNAKLFKNNVDVTEDFDASCFTWTRSSRDQDGDMYWNSNHNYGAKAITITASDVRINANFQCKFEYENISAVTDTAG